MIVTYDRQNILIVQATDVFNNFFCGASYQIEGTLAIFTAAVFHNFSSLTF